MSIRVSVEGRRGCGYRKVGGLYLMAGNLSMPCGRMPYELVVCAACGHGIKPARGWTWIDPVEAFEHELVDCLVGRQCQHCPLGAGGETCGRCGLIWIGEAHYPSPEAFTREAASMGISRRVSTLPRGFEVGKTWVLLAHRKAITRDCEECVEGWRESDGEGSVPVPCDECGKTGLVHVPAIFSAFVPERVEQVVAEDCTDEEADKIRERGIEPVIVRRGDEPGQLYAGD